MKEQILEVIRKSINNTELTENSKLIELNVNSIEFVKLIVALETAFGYDMPDNALALDNYETVKDLISYVEKIISSN